MTIQATCPSYCAEINHPGREHEEWSGPTEYLSCQLCPAKWPVSKLDPDSTLADGIAHLSVHEDGVTLNPAFALSLSGVSRR